MNDATVVSFEEALRSRTAQAAAPRRLTEDELRSRQGSVPFTQCHAALQNITVEVRTKKRRFYVFNDLSVAFPKGRKIAVLGHPESGKSTLVKLLKQRVVPKHGRILGGEGISWPLQQIAFLDPRMPLIKNLRFVATTFLGMPPRYLIDLVVAFCELDYRRLHEPTNGLAIQTSRRVCYAIALLKNFDCHLMDGPYRGAFLGFTGQDAERFDAFAFDRDYIVTAANANQLPPNVDLVYILYNGLVYMFEDVEIAKQTFKALPTPEAPGPAREPELPRPVDDLPLEGF